MQTRRKDWLIILIPALISLAVFLPALRNGFVAWDDPAYVYNNAVIQIIDFNSIKLIFGSIITRTDHWHPLTILSYAIDYRIWKLNPLGYHLTNVIINSINTGLLALVTLTLCRLSDVSERRSAVSAIAAALFFGIHPMHTESVTWISDRKDILSALFLFLSVVTYLNYAASNTRRALSYVLSLVFFLLALMSKSTAVTLPAILLIIDFFALKRFDNRQDAVRAILNKIPYVVIAAFITLLTIVVFSRSEAWRSLERFTIEMRIFTSIRAFIFYLYKTILPINLVPYYPYPAAVDYTVLIGAIAVLSIITAVCILLYRKQKLPLAVWIYYIVTLLPVAGIIQIGSQGAADRYSYQSSIGLMILAGCAVAYIFERLGGARLKAAIILTALLLTVMAALTVRQEAIWKDTLSLWTHEINVYPMGSPLPYNERGYAYQQIGNFDLAIKDYSAAITLNPEVNMLVYFDRADYYRGNRSFARAIANYNKAAELDPTYTDIYYYRGLTYQTIGEYDKAISDFGVTLEKKPPSAEVYAARGATYALKGDLARAIEDFTKAIGLMPTDSAIYQYRGTALLESGLYEKAARDFKTSVSLNPQNALAYYNLSLACTRLNDNANALYNMRIAANLGLPEAVNALQVR